MIKNPYNIEDSLKQKRIQELEKEYGAQDWRVALKIALEVAQEKFCKFKDKKEALEIGIRTGFAYQTGGIVAAPLEGFTVSPNSVKPASSSPNPKCSSISADFFMAHSSQRFSFMTLSLMISVRWTDASIL